MLSLIGSEIYKHSGITCLASISTRKKEGGKKGGREGEKGEVFLF